MTSETIYSNHAYGESMWYAEDERAEIIEALAEGYGETVEEFTPGFMENENEVDLVDAYNAYGDSRHNLEDGWEDLSNHTDMMMPHARNIFNAFLMRVAPLEPVMTVAEVAEEYDLNPSGIRDSIKRGRIVARKSGGTWLIKREDAYAEWGKRGQEYKWWPGDTEGAQSEEWRDSAGNILTLSYNDETERDEAYPDNPEVTGFLEEMGYSGAGDWQLA